MAALTPVEEPAPFPDVVASTVSTVTAGTLTAPVGAGRVMVVAYLQSVTTTRDTITVTDSRGNSYAVLPDIYLTNNLQLFVAVATVTSALSVGGTVTVTLDGGASRNRRLLSARAFSATTLPPVASIIKATGQGLSPASAPTPPLVTLAAVPTGHLMVAAVGTTLAGGEVTWPPAFPATKTRTASTAAGAGDKRLSSAWRLATTDGDKPLTATQAVPSPSPWGMIGLALPPQDVAYERGRIYQQRADEWIT